MDSKLKDQIYEFHHKVNNLLPNKNYTVQIAKTINIYGSSDYCFVLKYCNNKLLNTIDLMLFFSENQDSKNFKVIQEHCFELKIKVAEF